jgi:hypothetical protein
MATTIALLLAFFAQAEPKTIELHVSAKDPVFVAAPEKWEAAKEKGPPGIPFPFETYQVTPPEGRNAVCLISILDKDREQFTDADFLKKILRGDCRPYVSTPAELPKMELKSLKLKDGTGFYANFVDPDLVGKPVEKGKYKTATPVILSFGSKYLIKATILCDEIDGTDYREAMKIVRSIRIKKE